MKKISLTLLFLICSFFIYAQESATDTKQEKEKKAKAYIGLFKESSGAQCTSNWVIRNSHKSRLIVATVKFTVGGQFPGTKTSKYTLEPGEEKILGLACFGCGKPCRSASVVGARFK